MAWMVVVACGPKVEEPDGAQSSEGTTESQGAVDTGTSVSTTTTATDEPSAMVTSEAEVTSSPDPATSLDGTTDWSCGCEDSRPIAFDEPVREGFTAADLVAALSGTQLAWTWTGVAGEPTTNMRVDLVYEGGQVLTGPGVTTVVCS